MSEKITLTDEWWRSLFDAATKKQSGDTPKPQTTDQTDLGNDVPVVLAGAATTRRGSPEGLAEFVGSTGAAVVHGTVARGPGGVKVDKWLAGIEYTAAAAAGTFTDQHHLVHTYHDMGGGEVETARMDVSPLGTGALHSFYASVVDAAGQTAEAIVHEVADDKYLYLVVDTRKEYYIARWERLSLGVGTKSVTNESSNKYLSPRVFSRARDLN